MSGRTANVAGSPNFGKTSNSSSQSSILGMVKYFHDLPTMYQTYRRPPNREKKFFECQLWKINKDCGFFKWDEENAMNTDELQILKEENAKLRSKIVKEKAKRRRVEQEMKALNKELMAIKLTAANKWGWHKMWMYLTIFLVVVVLVRKN